MESARGPTLGWVILTMGTRPAELRRAVTSLGADPSLVVVNGGSGDAIGRSIRTASLLLEQNLGIPGGRARGVDETSADIVGFLDDDAELRSNSAAIVDAFQSDHQLGAVALRLVDEDGQTARRHVPRLGRGDPERSGEVALFLGGACAIRREAYEAVGGYYADLFYGHEEVELCWRLIDAGWRIRYLPDVEVFHPRTTIERHADGWERTGCNRVLIARRTLPWPVAVAHVAIWLVLGAVRAPGSESRRRYVHGWRRGWKHQVDRDPISWRGVWRLTRLGRPPIV